MSAKRILVLSPVAELGGAERVMVDILKYLDRSLFEPHIVFFQDGSLVRSMAERGYPTDVIPVSRLRNFASYLKTVISLRQIIRDRRIDAVVSWMPKAHLYGGIAALWERKPAVWWQHGIPGSHWLDRLVSRIPARGVICPSRPSANAQKKLASSRFVLLNHLGVDLSEFKPDLRQGERFRATNGIPQDALVFAFMGRLQRWKRPDIVIRAFNRVSRGRNTYLLILGGALFGLEEDFEAELKWLARQNPDPSRIVFLGHQNHVAPILSATDVMVHASLMEPFGMVIVEAMSLGITVIAVGRGGPGDMITDGSDGLLYDGSEEQLVEIMQRILDGELPLADIGQSAARTVKEKFTVQRMAGNFEKNLDFLLNL